MAWIRFNYTGKYWEEAVDETDPATLFTQLDVSAAAIVSGNLAVARMPVSGTWTLTGDLTISGAKFNVPAPTTNTEAATKKYVDDNIPVVTGYVPYTGASGAVNLGSQTLQTAAIGLGTGPSTAGIVIPSAVPSSTTNALYNDAGTLKFNGVAIGSSGTVTGTGTAGKIAKFSDTTVIADSILSESGAIATITGSLAITAQPMCRVYKSADSSALTYNTANLITFDSEETDTGTMHSTSTNTGRLTVAEAGVYLIVGQVEYYEPTNYGTHQQFALIKRNGTEIARTQLRFATNGTTLFMQVAAIVVATATQYFELYAGANSGGPNPGTAVVQGGAASNTFFSAYKLS